MSDDAVWKRLDEHTTKIDSLSVEQAVTKAEVRALERRLDKSLAGISDTLARMEAKQDSAFAYQNKQKGATYITAWIIGTAITASAVIATLWANVFGN